MAQDPVQPHEVGLAQLLGALQQLSGPFVARSISRFSASLSVRIRSESISSISVPSKKSPGLSGATVG